MSEFGNLLNTWSNIVVIGGGVTAGLGYGFTYHRHRKSREERHSETRQLVDKHTATLDEHTATLARIEKKLVPNGRNTQNPGDLLALICDHLGIDLPGSEHG
jgi:hypothetical protein